MTNGQVEIIESPEEGKLYVTAPVGTQLTLEVTDNGIKLEGEICVGVYVVQVAKRDVRP